MTKETSRRARRIKTSSPACFLVCAALGLASSVCGRAAPAAPASFVATPVSWTQVRLTWADQSANETGFVIERRLGAAGAWTPAILAEANTTRIDDTGLAAGTSCTYRIKAVDTSGGASAYVTSAAVTTPAARKRPPIVVMPLGDSITRGTGGTQAGYRDPLYTLLTNAGYPISYVGSETLTPTTLLTQTGNDHHEGHGGYAIPQISSGLDGSGTGWLTGVPGTREPVYPDVILLMAGTNDIGTGASTGAVTLARMDALLGKIDALRPSALTLVSTLVPYFGTAETREQRQLDYNAGLPALVAAHRAAGHRVWLYDMRTKVNQASQISGDGVHPNQTGYNAIAAGWFEAFQTLPLIETWRHAKFGSAAASGGAADLADPDGDGMANLLEYAVGGEPKSAAGSASLIAPRPTLIREAGNDYLALAFLRRRHADIGYVVETAPALSLATAWSGGAVQLGVPLAVDSSYEQVICRDALAMEPNQPRFIRVRILTP